MTYEEKKAYDRKYHAQQWRRLTREQKDKKNEYKRFWSANRTEEQKLRRSKYQTTYREINKEKLREKRDIAKYGTKDRESLFLEQKGCCAICGRKQTDIGYPLHIDHCHKTGNVRGLLCKHCNTGIGMLKDDVAVMDKAKAYLYKHSASKMGNITITWL